MENFTDIFGEDLAALEDLGNLGNFGGGGGDLENNSGGQQQQQQPQPPGPQQVDRKYAQQQFSQHNSKIPGYAEYGGYRPGAPAQYGYNNPPAGHGPAGYPPNPTGYPGHGAGPQGMMGGPPGTQPSYPGYPPGQSGMSWQQSSQNMMGGPRMYGQSGYPPSGPGMPGHFPGYDQRSGPGSMQSFGQAYPNYPPGSSQNIPQGYPGQPGMPGYHPSSQMKSGYAASSAHSSMPNPYQQGSSQSMAQNPSQYPGGGQYRMPGPPGGGGQYPAGMPGSQLPPGRSSSSQQSMPPASQSQQMTASGGPPNVPNMPPSRSQMLPGGPGVGPGGNPMSASGLSSRSMPGGPGPGIPTGGPQMMGKGPPGMPGMPSGMMPSGGPGMSQSMPNNPNIPAGAQQLPGMIASNPPGGTPGGGSSPMYRSPFPPQPSPQMSPHSQASPMPQRSPLPPSTNSPAPHTQSPVSSPAPPRTPNSIQGRMTPTGNPPTPGQPSSASSLQQLEQMVMPSSKNNPADISQQHTSSPHSQGINSSQQHRSSPHSQGITQNRSSPHSQGLTQTNSPLGAKTPSSPSMRGAGTPLSPQQWNRPSSQPGSNQQPSSNQLQAGQGQHPGLQGQLGGPPPPSQPNGPGSQQVKPKGPGGPPGPAGMHPMFPQGFQQHPGMPMNMLPGMPMDQARMQHPSMQSFPGRMPHDPSISQGPQTPQTSSAGQHSMLGHPPTSLPSSEQSRVSPSTPLSSTGMSPAQPDIPSNMKSIPGHPSGMPVGPRMPSSVPPGVQSHPGLPGGPGAPQGYPGMGHFQNFHSHPGMPSMQVRPTPPPPATTEPTTPPGSVTTSGSREPSLPKVPDSTPDQTSFEKESSEVDTPSAEAPESPVNTDLDTDISQQTVTQSNAEERPHQPMPQPSQSTENVPESSTETAVPTSTSDDNDPDAKADSGDDDDDTDEADEAEPDTTVKPPASDGSTPSTSTIGMSSQGPMDPRMMMGPNGPAHPGMHPGMGGQFPQGYAPGPPMSQAGPMTGTRPRMMMGPNGPMPMGSGGGPMGPMRFLPPNHPIMMEMEALHQHIQGLYQQPQNSANQKKMAELQGRMRTLQAQMAQQSGWGPPPPQGAPPGGPIGPANQLPGGPSNQPSTKQDGPVTGPDSTEDTKVFRDLGAGRDLTAKRAKGHDVYDFDEPSAKDPYAENFDEEMVDLKKKPKKPPKEKKPKPEKEVEPKVPKKRGPKPKIKYNEAGEPIDPATEKKPKRQYNRKKKPEPGALLEEEKVEVPPEALVPPPLPPPASVDTKPVENGETEDATSLPDSAPSTSALHATPTKEEAEEPEEKKKLPSPRVKVSTPKKPKPSKTLLQFAKKKRKRTNSEGSDLDLDKTPPPSPTEEESGIEKRRSGRNTKRKKYVDDVQYNFSDEDLKGLPKDAAKVAKTAALDDILGPEESKDGGSLDNSLMDGEVPSGPNYAFVDPTAEDTMIVQLILASRIGKRELEDDEEDVVKEETEAKTEEKAETKSEAGDESKDGEDTAKTSDKTKDSPRTSRTDIDSPDKAKTSGETDSAEDKSVPNQTPEKSKKARMVDIEEYLVKFKNFSYLHCQWLTEPELLRGDKRITAKIRRFQQKRQQSGNVLEFCEEEPFNPDYVEVDRVLDASEHTDDESKVTTKHYLVKWRSLPYEDCTWELEADVDPAKIKDYQRWKDPPVEGETTDKKRPRKSEWKEMTESPVFKNNNKLRPYQLEGVNWLNFSWYNQRNCLLADEMGLGKTIQSLAWIHSIWSYGIRGPFLVIAPLSTIPNWQREFELWTDLNVIVYHGSQTSRNMIQEYEMYYKNSEGERIPGIFKFHVLITTYECIITDIMDLKDISWRACVIDEAHRLKNQKCKLLEGLRLLEIEARLLLSGTPLQNNINELFSLLSFLEPSQFNSLTEFTRDFGDMQNEEQVVKLQALLKPLMLRRMKEDVEKSLKPKEETIVEVELTNIQKKYYRGILERNFTFLKSSTNANVPNLMNTMMELRKCCIHPYLLNGAEEQIQNDYRRAKKDYTDEDDLYYKALVHASGKMVLLDKLLPKLKSNGNRVLIFSQMVKMLDILEDYLIRRKYPFERIDGRIRGNLRQAAIDRFCRPDSDRFVFLLCTKAGGLGINLTAADTCIIYDSDWNPQNDLQAQARCHRIGQKKMVKIYRLVTKNTYEREMLDRAGMKLGLDKAVLQSMNTNQGGREAGISNSLSKQDVETLLKKGAYGALMDDDNAGDKFCEEDIEDILSRRATTITHEEEKGSTFSKATFSTADSATDISIDDPDFWKKWAKKAEIEEMDETMKLMMVEPRNRKKIDRFGGNETLDPNTVSDLDSSSDSDTEKTSSGRTREQKIKDKLKSIRQGKGKRTRRSGWTNEDEDFMEDERDIEYGAWNRNDLFRLEKGLMCYGWGRWEEVLAHAQLRKGWTHTDVEDAVRLSLLYCLHTYNGEENIKKFIWELIAPGSNNTVSKNHSGLSAPVPRGRKTKKVLRKEDRPEGTDWVLDEKYEPELFLDKSYRKHLDRYNNKLLLRIRLLYYIQHEILGDHLTNINSPGYPASSINLYIPTPEGFVTSWWDTEADKSLLVGCYRHGFERYNMMRLDPGLCFLSRCGPPDNAAVQAELDNLNKPEDGGIDDDDDDSSSATPSRPGSRPPSVKPDEENGSSGGYLPFPDHPSLNSRVRKLVSAFQRENKKEEARQAAKEKREERRERIEQVMREREKQKVEQQQKKWSRREESNFLRTILAFGVDKKDTKYNWDRFRLLARLEAKYEETLTEYFLAFFSMCKKVAGISLTEEEELVSGSVEAITEDKARKVLERVDFLSRLREDVAGLPDLRERLDRLAEPALDLPEWWIPGKHDTDLVLGAARHGVSRMEYYVLNDIELSFKDVLKRSLGGEPLVDKEELARWADRRRDRKVNGAHAEKNGKSRNLSGKSDITDPEEERKENGDLADEDKMDTGSEKFKMEKTRAVEKSAIRSPQLNFQQIEAAMAKGVGYDQEMINDLMAQTYAANVRWPKDKVLLVRLQHIISAVEEDKWPVAENFTLLEAALDNSGGTDTPDHTNNHRDTSTPLSEMSEVSQYDDGNVLTHGGLANRKKRGRRPLDCPDEKAKLRGMLQSSTPLSASSLVSSNKASTDDSMSDASGNRPSGETAAGEETASPSLDLKSASKGSKLESALDKLGLQKRKLSDAPADDKSAKKKRLDDLLSGLHAGKGNSVPEKKESAMDTLFKKATESTDLNKLQEMLGPLGGNPGDAKVQKWLADQMGVTPERPITPGSSAATATSGGGKRPASTASSAAGGAGGWMEWMSKLSGDEHVTVFNRSTGKKLSGPQGPKLKYLAQWLIEHPMFEVDPKWAEEVRQKDDGKKKGPGRPPLDESPAGKKVSSPSSGIGPSYNSMASLGLDPKNPMSALAALDPKNPNSLAALYGLDPKKLDPMTAAMLGLGDPKNPMKMDPMMMAALSMDPKTLQALGIDPKKLTSMASPATSKSMDPKSSKSASGPSIDPMLLAAFGMDPKNPKLDAVTAAALGLDPKNPKIDPMILASLGLDPKHPNSTLLAAMAAMDPNNQMAAMYGLMPPGFPMPGMDMYGKGKHSPQQSKESKSPLPAPSPRSSSQREGPSPRPPSRASQSSRDGRSTPRSSAHQNSSFSQASPRSTSANSAAGMFGGLNPSMFGLDPKMFAQMDPKTLQAAGIDPKLLAQMDPKMMAMMLDPRMAGMDLKALSQMDPKLLQSAGIDPKMLAQMMDPKTSMAGFDPKMFGLDPKSALGGLDPKMLGIDPKLLAGMDPKLLQSMGIDPKMLGLDMKSSQQGFDPKSFMGMDPKLLAGMDPKLLSDPKFLASLDPKMLLGLDPKLLGMDPKMFGFSSSGTSSSPNSSRTQSSGHHSSTVPTSATSTMMSIPSSLSGLLDPRLLGLDPKMLQGLDEKGLKRLGLDPGIVKSLLASEKPKSSGSGSRSSAASHSSKPNTTTSTTFSGLDPKMFTGMDPKMFDPKNLSMMDPKMMAMMYGYDPKMLASMDPKTLASFGIDPKWFDPKAMGMDPKTFQGVDPKALGLDPKMLQGMDPKLLQSFGIDPKYVSGSESKPASSAATSLPASSSALDPKLLASMGMDPKMLAGIDPKILASYGIDPKMLQGFDQKGPGTSSSSSSSNAAADLKAFGGIDPKHLAAAGIDPKMLASMDPKVLASLGLDAKSLAAALDPKNLSKSLGGMDPKQLAGMDPKLLAGMDPKLLAGLDPKMLGGYDPKMLGGLDPKMLASMGIDPKMLSDPKFLQSMGLDPKSMASLGMDPKMLASMGLDPKALSAMGLDSKTLAAMGLDPKAMSSAAMGGMDPKMLASMGMDPKMMASLGMDPKMLAAMGMDPKTLASMGMDPKMLASLGMDPKALAALGMDPKALASLGMDPKALSSLGMDPKTMAASMGLDPKALSSMGFDPKMLAGIDSKTLASMGIDPKVASDPNLMAMYAMGMPGMMPPLSMSNGIGGASGTPLPGTKGGSGGAPAKPKPGTVAAALQEKKESEKARSEHSGEENSADHEKNSQESEEEELRRGLTSEERVLLREKKKERLMKEVEGDGTDHEGGLNLSVSRHAEMGSTKLEALLNKPIDEPADSNRQTLNNGESPSSEGV